METSVHGGVWKPDHHLPSVSLPRTFYLVHDPIIYSFRSHPGFVLHTHTIILSSPLLLGSSHLAFMSSITLPCSSCFKSSLIYSSERKCIKERGWRSVQSGRGGKQTQHWVASHKLTTVSPQQPCWHARTPQQRPVLLLNCLWQCALPEVNQGDKQVKVQRVHASVHKWRETQGSRKVLMCRRGRQKKRSKSASEWNHVWMRASKREREKGRDLEATTRRTGRELETKKKPEKQQQFSSSLHLQLAAIWHRSLAAPCHCCRAKVGQSEYSCGSVLCYITQLGFQMNFLFVSHLMKSFSPTVITCLSVSLSSSCFVVWMH